MITIEYKTKIRTAVIDGLEKFEGTDKQFARSLDIHPSIFSRLKNGELDKILSDEVWVRIAKQFQVQSKDETWVVAKTDVYLEMEDQIRFCKETAKAMMLVDDSGVGKTECSMDIVRGLENAFYIDCSQCKKKLDFIRELAAVVGVDVNLRITPMFKKIKEALRLMSNPILVFDEFGDLEYLAFLAVKELWNATEGHCGMFALGAQALKVKIQKGMYSNSVGYHEMFRRFGEMFTQYSPVNRYEREEWYKKMYTQIAAVNVADPKVAKGLVDQCLKQMSLVNEERRHMRKINPKKYEFSDNYIPTPEYLKTLVKLHNAA